LNHSTVILIKMSLIESNKHRKKSFTISHILTTKCFIRACLDEHRADILEMVNVFRSVNEGINKTLWDEIKQLKNQIEGEKRLKTNGLYQFVWIMFTFELNSKQYLCLSVYEGKRCPDSWMRFGCSCYYKSTEKKTWNESRDFCQENGSDLVVVNSKEEQVGVFTLVPSSFLCLGFSTCIFHVYKALLSLYSHTRYSCTTKLHTVPRWCKEKEENNII
uniref:C-type lectin domain-containing protein n=1 Tax=Oryzias latipes TaxID=8090 RepID=A0A3B3HWN6_ORYLA